MPAPAANTFDQFDAVQSAPAGNPFDQFDGAAQEPELSASEKFSRVAKNILGYLPPVAAADAGLSLMSGAVAGPTSGLAGIGAAGTNAAGLTNTPAADVVEKVGDAMTYQPRTAGGRMLAGAIAYPFEKLAQAGNAAGNAVNVPVASVGKDQAPVSYSPGGGGWPMGGAEASPLAATLLNTAVQAAPSFLLHGQPRILRGAKAVETPKPIAPRQALIDELGAKGLKVTPTQAGKPIAGVVEGMAGPAKLERSLSLKNAPKINELVGEDVGLKGAKTITEADLTRLKVEANKPYNALAKTGIRKVSDEFRAEIASIGDKTGGESFKAMVPRDIRNMKRMYAKVEKFSAQDVINQIRQLRSEGSKNVKAINAPEQNAKGHVQRAIAEALDNELLRHAESLGKADLVRDYKAARVQLAKVYTLQDALEGSNISPRELARARERGAPLNGNMDLIARAHTEFDRAFQDVGKIRDSNPFGAIDVGAAVVGAATNPALATAVVARPLTRAYLASDRYQRSLSSKRSGTKEAQAPRLKPVVASPNEKRASK